MKVYGLWFLFFDLGGQVFGILGLGLKLRSTKSGVRLVVQPIFVQ